MKADPGAPVLTVLGRLPSGSNAVFACGDEAGQVWVYKPVRGERPLADFPAGSLAAREVAAYEVSDALGWDLVPETVVVVGPGGPGSAQRWIDEDPEADQPVGLYSPDALPEGHAAVVAGEDEDGDAVVLAHRTDAVVRRFALFDEIVNNADRKGGHLLVDSDGRERGIDHGLSFHTEPKVRTVLWGFAGAPVAAEDLPGIAGLAAELEGGMDGRLLARLGELLDADEVEALRARVRGLVAAGTHPLPGSGYPLPWPLF